MSRVSRTELDKIELYAPKRVYLMRDPDEFIRRGARGAIVGGVDGIVDFGCLINDHKGTWGIYAAYDIEFILPVLDQFQIRPVGGRL